jgi:CBS-domain-containing membrane protein
MNSAIERLLGLRVKDIMNSDVITVRSSDTMQEAAARLFDAEVSGAPVTDEVGRCVGVLSASDFLARDADQHPTEILVQDSPDEPYRVEVVNDELVATHMCPLIQTISPEAPVLQAARILCREHIHRLVVVDEHQRPVGLVSSLDVVASMVASIEE